MKQTTNINPFTPASKGAAQPLKTYPKAKKTNHKVNSPNG